MLPTANWLTGRNAISSVSYTHLAVHGVQAFDGIGVERYVWIVFQQFTAYPTFYSGSTVSATDDADRNLSLIHI